MVILWQAAVLSDRCGILAQATYWPAAFPEPSSGEAVIAEEDSAGSSREETDSAGVFQRTDSTFLTLTSTTALTQIFKTHSKLEWEQTITEGFLYQYADYQFIRSKRNSHNQYLDLSGTIMKNNLFTDGLNAGFEWAPVVSYSKRPADATNPDIISGPTGALQSNVDFGPVVTHSLFSIPYSVRGGLYSYAWNDSIPSLTSAPPSSYRAVPGVYGGCTIGSKKDRIGSLPLYLSVNALGRVLRGNNLGLFSGSLYYGDRVPFSQKDDSLFAYISDSLSNGKEVYIGEYVGKSFYSNTSWRINHSFLSAAGVTFAERFGIASRFYYQFYMNTIAYPSKLGSLDDKKISGHVAGLGLSTGADRQLVYRGGIEFTWEYEDWLYRRDFEENTTPETRDAYLKNLYDHQSDIARTDHVLSLHLPWGITLKDSLHAFKDSKNYWGQGDFFDTDLELKRNKNENDRVQIDNQVSVRYGRDSLFSIELYGSYGKQYHYYYHELRSAQSLETDEYRLGVTAGLNLGFIELNEHLYGDAEITDYYFKKVGGATVKPPPYTRDVTSTLSGKWRIFESRFFLTGKWTESYLDNGLWYGRAYWPDSTDNDREYYAIESKEIDYWIDGAVEWVFREDCKLVAGSIVHDVYQRDWDSKTAQYLAGENDPGFVEPYAGVRLMFEQFIMKLKIKRNISTQGDEQWKVPENWEMLLDFKWIF